MSKSALSATVQAHILKRVRSQADKFLSGTKLKIFDKKGKEIFNPEVGFSLEQIRKETNLNQEASVSRGGLKQLANTFKLLTEKSVLAADAVALLGRDNIFDELSNFLLQKVNKQENAASIRSRSGAFKYTGVRENEIDTTAKLATAKNREESFKDVVLVNNISHGKFNEYFVEFLRTQTTATTELVDFIKENIDTGHLSGVFNIRLQRIFGLKVQQTNRSNYRSMAVTFSDTNEELNDIFQKIVTLISDADYLSSNIKLNLELFSNTTKIIYDKDGPKVSVETQLSLSNQEIGRKLAASSRYLNQLLDAAKTTAVRADAVTAGKEMQKFLTSLKPLADEVNILAQTLKNSDVQIPANVQKVVDDILSDNITVQRLLSTEGSDPALTSIIKTIGSIFDGKKIPNKQVSGSKDKAVSQVKAKGRPKQTVVIAPIKKKQVQVRASQGAITKVSSIISLQNLINANLHDQIKKNMGTGTRKDVLNYRSGRFAESAKVERLSESRQGMITAFYSYMKNPYATFSRGGRQDRPYTRDPKLLISKSIRELAGAQVANRMRAVLV
jgi:hypothetical protein